MPQRTKKEDVQGATDLEKAAANVEAGPVTNANSKSALQKRFEEFMTASKVKWVTIEERVITAEGRKMQVCFADFPEGKGKDAIKELLYRMVAFNDQSGYAIEVEPNEEVLLFFKD